MSLTTVIDAIWKWISHMTGDTQIQVDLTLPTFSKRIKDKMRPEDMTLFTGFKTPEIPGLPALRYFQFSEFDSPDQPGSGTKMDMEFLKTLDYIRDACGFPFKINSGYRTQAHNDALKAAGHEAVDDSAHTKGKACDIAIENSSQRMILVKTALKYGIYRIGLGKTFCHLDCDMDKPRMVIWLYGQNR